MDKCTAVEATSVDELASKAIMPFDAAVIGPDFQYSPESHLHWQFRHENLLKSSSGQGEFRFRQVEYPFHVTSETGMRKLTAVYDIINGGAALVCIVNGANRSAAHFARDIMAAQCVYLMEQAVAGSGSGVSSLEKSHGTGEHYLDIPLPVGLSSFPCNLFGRTESADNLRWTAVWALTLDPLLQDMEKQSDQFIASLQGLSKEESINRVRSVFENKDWIFPESFAGRNPTECLQEIISLMRNLCKRWKGNARGGKASGVPAEIWTMKKQFLKNFIHFSHLLKLPSDAMLSPVQARESFETSNELSIIDIDSKGWPVAFTRRCGEGSITVAPPFNGYERLAGELKDMHRSRDCLNGRQLVEAYFRQWSGPQRKGDDKRTYTIRITREAVEAHHEYNQPGKTIVAAVSGNGIEEASEVRLSWLRILQLAHLYGLRRKHGGGVAYRTKGEVLEIYSCCYDDNSHPELVKGLGIEIWRPEARQDKQENQSDAVPGCRSALKEKFSNIDGGNLQLFAARDEIKDPSSSTQRYNLLKLADGVEVRFEPSAGKVLGELGERIPEKIRDRKQEQVKQIIKLFNEG